LNESIIQNSELKSAIKNSISSEETTNADSEISLAKLYHRIYYTKILEGAPYETGDVFKFDDDEYGILFTPECDVNKKKDVALEFLLFKKAQFDEFLQSKKQYSKTNYETMTSKDKQKKDLLGQFNNGNIAFHILPSFPFKEDEYNQSAYIDFENAFSVKSKTEYDSKRTNFKLNSPYIHQLRQRYLAYMGRVGVPATPESLRLFNLR
jgi:hypothetical protein